MIALGKRDALWNVGSNYEIFNFSEQFLLNVSKIWKSKKFEDIMRELSSQIPRKLFDHQQNFPKLDSYKYVGSKT